MGTVMTATAGPGLARAIAQARELIDQVLQGAQANQRAGLIDRLHTARRSLGPSVSPEADARLVRSAAAEASRALKSLEADLRARQAMLADPARAARLRAELADVRARHERFTKAAREWPYLLGDGFAAINSDIDYQLRTRIRAIVDEAEIAINKSDPKKNAEPLQAWLRERLSAEADLASGRVRAGAANTATTLARALDLPTPHRIPPLRVVPGVQLLNQQTPRAPTPAGREPVSARLMTVLMPAYGGIMMSVIGPRIFGLAMPGWLIAIVAVAGALALGGGAASAERGRHRDRRRGEAITALRASTDNYQMAVAKQLHDAARELQQDLRGATTATVARLGEVLGAELDTVSQAADTAHRTDALSDITDDLAALAALGRQADALRRIGPDGAAPVRNLTLLSGDGGPVPAGHDQDEAPGAPPVSPGSITR
jgi:hypothetical protein